MQMINPPCKECTTRYTICHDSCTKYKQYTATKEKIKLERSSYMNERSIMVESVSRLKRG